MEVLFQCCSQAHSYSLIFSSLWKFRLILYFCEDKRVSIHFNVYKYICIYVYKVWGFYNCSWICCSSSRNVVGEGGRGHVQIPSPSSWILWGLNTTLVSRRALPDFHFHDIGKDLIQTEHHWEVAAQKRGLVQTVIICNKMGASEAAWLPLYESRLCLMGEAGCGGVGFFSPILLVPSWWKIHKQFLVTVVQNEKLRECVENRLSWLLLSIWQIGSFVIHQRTMEGE